MGELVKYSVKDLCQMDHRLIACHVSTVAASPEV